MQKVVSALTAASMLVLAPLPASVSSSARAQVNFSNSEPRDAQSEAIDCSQSRLQPPSGLNVKCGRYPVSNSHCLKQGYVVESTGSGPSMFVFAMTQRHTSKYCGIAAPQSVRTDMVMSIKKYRPFVHDEVMTWDKKPFDLKHAGLALLFDSPNSQRDGKCVAFYQPGPPVVNYGADAAPTHSYERDYYYRGWICAPPGQTLTKDAANNLIKSFKVTAK